MSGVVANYFAACYSGSIVAIQNKFCPNCLKKGKPEVKKIPKSNKAAFWEDLMESNELDPIHALNCFIPKSVNSIAQFKHTPLNLFNPGEPCADKSLCTPHCFVCRGPIDSATKFSTVKGAVKYQAHNFCLTRCKYNPNFKTKNEQCCALVPVVPMYIPDMPPVMCKMHSRMVRGGEEETITDPNPSAPPNAPYAKIITPGPAKAAKEPTKPPPKKPRVSKLERDSERGRSKDIKQMFGGSAPASGAPVDGRARVVFTPHEHLKHKYPKKIF